jgi:flagellar hook-associated protein 3 FlgL
MQAQQYKLNQTQMQLSTGKKLLAPSDDPASESRIIDLNQSIKQTEQYQNNINAARQRLTLEEGTLQHAADILQRVNELGVQGLNASYSAADRTIMAVEVEELNQQLLGLANTRNANGEYLFAGFKSATQPFSQDAANVGAYLYAGDTSTRAIQIDSDRQIADGDSGNAVFGMPTGGPPPAPGAMTNVFEALDKLATDLRANTPNAASLDDISKALDRLLTVQASVGTRLNALDNQESRNEDFVINMKAVLSATEDLDYAEAISRFNLQTVALQAAQQAFAQVKKLSLFNYL